MKEILKTGFGVFYQRWNHFVVSSYNLMCFILIFLLLLKKFHPKFYLVLMVAAYHDIIFSKLFQVTEEGEIFVVIDARGDPAEPAKEEVGANDLFRIDTSSNSKEDLLIKSPVANDGTSAAVDNGLFCLDTTPRKDSKEKPLGPRYRRVKSLFIFLQLIIYRENPFDLFMFMQDEQQGNELSVHLIYQFLLSIPSNTYSSQCYILMFYRV